MKRAAPVLILLALWSASPVSAAADRWWFGGGLGLAFGEVDYISIEPIIGYRAAPNFTVGARLIARYTNDGRYDPSISTTDYGAGVFARYFVSKPVFLQAEYEYLGYEYYPSSGSTTREWFGSVLGGVGFSQPISEKASLFVLGLYNFSYDENEPSPYSDAFILRVGVGVSF